MYTLLFIYVILQEKSSKQTATNSIGPENGTSLEDLKGEPSASLASFYSKAIHSARCHNREEQSIDNSLPRGLEVKEEKVY